jgi:uncharacterized DUF497 family protein
MADFDPAKDAINLSKHGVSLARWIDLEIFAIARDDRFDYGEVRYRAYGLIDAQRIVWFSPFATGATDRSACDVPMQRN